MNKLSRYIIQTTFLAMIGGVLGLWFLQLIFAYLSELQDLNEQYSITQAFWYVLYRSPYFLVQFTPTGVLLGAVIGLGILSGNSEITAMRAAGISLTRIIGKAMIPALFFVVLSLAVNEWILPPATQKARQIRAPSEEIIAVHGYWSIDDSADNRQITYIDKADEQGNLTDVQVFYLQGQDLLSVLSAQAGVYQKQYQWQLLDVNQVWLQNTQTQHTDWAVLTLPIAQSSVHLLTKDAEDLSISELYAYKKLMQHQHRYAKRHELVLYQKLFSPFLVLSLLLVACSFVFGSLRSSSLGFRVVIALLTGLLFSYVQDLSGFVSLATDLSPLWMSILPQLLGVGLGLYLLHKKS